MCFSVWCFVLVFPTEKFSNCLGIFVFGLLTLPASQRSITRGQLEMVPVAGS